VILLSFDVFLISSQSSTQVSFELSYLLNRQAVFEEHLSNNIARFSYLQWFLLILG
jgi:hypothetical protein